MIQTCDDCGYVSKKKLACPKCNSNSLHFNKWINKVKIKNLFVDNPTDSDTLKCCIAIISQLETILKNNIDVINSAGYLALDEIIDAFKFIKQSIEEGKELYDDDCITYAELFNRYLDELYDLGDTTLSNDRQHFLWID